MRRLLLLALLLTAAPAGAVKVCPDGETVEGIDVSKWQGAIDWAKVKASGRVFAIARVSDGLAYKDSYFDANWKAMKEVGLVRGVYQFVRSDEDPVAQANYLISKIGTLEPGDLPPVADVESVDGQTPAQIAENLGQWMQTIQNALGVTPMIYTGGYFWNTNVKTDAFTLNPLWVANWTTACPSLPTAWTGWKFWQYSATGSVPGINGDVDLDRFNGSLEDLQKFAGMGGCEPHCEGTVMVGKDCGKGDCAAYGATCVDDDLGLRCVSVFCPAKGSATVCVPGETNGIIGTCLDGQLTTGDCGGFGAICSTAAGPDAKCVSAFCATTATEPLVEKDVCLPDGDRYACSATGDLTKTPCPPSYLCSMAQPGGAHCVASACVGSAAEAPVEKDLCIGDALYHCDAAGVLTPKGTSCDGPPPPPPDDDGPPPAPDAGSEPAAASDVSARVDTWQPPARVEIDDEDASDRPEVVRHSSGGCSEASGGAPSGWFFCLLLIVAAASNFRGREGAPRRTPRPWS